MSHLLDGDNDGWYFRGGRARVDGVAVVNAKDDCVDSASSKGRAGGELNITRSLLAPPRRLAGVGGYVPASGRRWRPPAQLLLTPPAAPGELRA